MPGTVSGNKRQGRGVSLRAVRIENASIFGMAWHGRAGLVRYTVLSMAGYHSGYRTLS